MEAWSLERRALLHRVEQGHGGITLPLLGFVSFHTERALNTHSHMMIGTRGGTDDTPHLILTSKSDRFTHWASLTDELSSYPTAHKA